MRCDEENDPGGTLTNCAEECQDKIGTALGDYKRGSTPKPSELFAVLIYQSVTHKMGSGNGIRRSILPEVIETVGGKLM